jgi:hypothetical protein
MVLNRFQNRLHSSAGRFADACRPDPYRRTVQVAGRLLPCPDFPAAVPGRSHTDTYVLAARRVITIDSAMPALEPPVAINSNTSGSRGVKASSGSALRCQVSILETIVRSSADPPSATRWSAAMDSLTSLTRSFNK